MPTKLLACVSMAHPRLLNLQLVHQRATFKKLRTGPGNEARLYTQNHRLTSLMTVALFWEVVSLPPPLRDLTCSSHLAARAERALGAASSSSLCFISSIIFLALSFLSSLSAASFFACSSWILFSSSSVRRCDFTSLSRSLNALELGNGIICT